MRVAVFSTKPYDQRYLMEANEKHEHDLVFFEPRLNRETARLAANFGAVCIFVNDQADATVLNLLANQDVKLIALRSAGFNNVNLGVAQRLGLCVARVPAYSPYAVAEHTVALMLALNRKIYRAYERVREGNFALQGLLGFDMHGKVAGLIGTGKIGAVTATILRGFGCEVLAYDPYPNPQLEQDGILKYVPLEELLRRSDIVSLHSPLTPETRHIINSESLQQMKQGVMLINTSRGALVDTSAVIEALKSGKIGYLGLDVYEEEAGLFFEDLSDKVLQDDIFARLLTFPNVIITGHQAFFTETALRNIADTTMNNITEFAKTGACQNAVQP